MLRQNRRNDYGGEANLKIDDDTYNRSKGIGFGAMEMISPSVIMLSVIVTASGIF